MTSRGEHIRLEKGSVVKHHYEVIASVGSGNFSKVYRVIDLQLPSREQKRKPLAMKVIKKEYSSDAKYEKQMLITLHKNDKNHSARVSKMYECFVFQECPVFIMPIHGPSIRNRRLGINRGVVTREKVLEFAFDILETMDFVHFQCHMVHTDLKPENILIADSNVAENSMGDEWVVCDFGSASLWRMDKLDSDLISTRPYRAPEVVLGNKWHYAADMWSVGCILYEVAVGHRLFEIRDDLTHLHMMDRRINKLPEAFTKNAKYSSKYFNARGEFLATPDVIRFGKCRLTPLREMFRDDRDFLQLLEGLFIYDPSARMTATEALALPMFDSVRAARRQRQQRLAEEAEARRQRRRAAAGVTNGATTAAAGEGESESLMSTVASTSGGGAGVVNGGPSPRLTDRTDHNLLEPTSDDAGGSVKKQRSQPLYATNTALNTTATTSTNLMSSFGGKVSETGRSTITSSADDVSANTRVTPTASGHDSQQQQQQQLQPVRHSSPGSRGENDMLEKSTEAASSPLTGRSAVTDTNVSHRSANASPGKNTVTSRGGGGQSNAGSTSRHSTAASSAINAGSASGAAGTRAKTGKTRARASSSPAGGAKLISVAAAASTSSAASSSFGAGGVVMKEVPSQRPVVDNHRASTGGISSTTVVPKLALNKLTSLPGETGAAATTTAGTTPTSKGSRTPGSTTKQSGGASERKSAGLHRTASPAQRRSLSKSKRSSSQTPRKAGKHSRKSSRDASDDGTPPTSASEKKKTSSSSSSHAAAAAVPNPVVPHAPTNMTATTTLADGATRNARGVPTVTSPGASAHDTAPASTHHVQRPSPQPETKEPVSTSTLGDQRGAQTTPTTAAATTTSAGSHGSPTIVVTKAVPLSSTPVRAPSATPLGYQSPLERGVTAVGLTTRTEPPADYGSLDRDSLGGAGQPPSTSQTKRKDSSSGNSGEEREDTAEQRERSLPSSDASATAATATSAQESGLFPSPSSTNPDGSPRATDYRSPVRRRPPAVTPTDDTSPQTSPEPLRHNSTQYASGSSGEWVSMEHATPSPTAAAGVVAARKADRVSSHPFPQTQPPPNLGAVSSTALSDGRRTPREISPAPVTGRGQSPVGTARRSPHLGANFDPPATMMTATSTTTTTTTTITQTTPSPAAAVVSVPQTADASELTSAVPIVRASLSRGNSRSESVASTLMPSPNPDALARTVGPTSSSSNNNTAAPSLENSSSVLAQTTHPALSRSPLIGSVAPRVASAGARPGAGPVGNIIASSTPTPIAAASASTVTATAAPSMKPVITVAASVDRLKSVPPQNIADVRGPSAIPVSASRRTVVKPSPAGVAAAVGAAAGSNNSSSNNNSNSGSGIPEHPTTSPLMMATVPSAPQGAAAAAAHPPEAVTRSRERSLVLDPIAIAEKEKAASRRGSTSSPNLFMNATGDAITPKTPLPSAAAAAAAVAGTGTASLSSSVSLPSPSSHPTQGVVRQRSGSGHLLPGAHPTSSASGLESNPMVATSQLAVYTPRGSRVLQEHQIAVSARSSAAATTLPVVLPSALTSPPPPSRSGRSSLSLTAPGVTAGAGHDGELTSGRQSDHAAPATYTTVESRPSTPRGSGRSSVKALDLQQLHPSTATTAPRPPRRSSSSSATTAAAGTHSGGGLNSPRMTPIAPASAAAAVSALKSPRYSPRLNLASTPTNAAGSGNNSSSAAHASQNPLNSSTGSLHLGVTRSPRRPVAPGAHNNNLFSAHSTTTTTSVNGANANAAGTMSLMSSIDAASAVSLRSPRSSSRLSGTTHSSTSRKEGSKTTISPRRAPLSPRGKPSQPSGGRSASPLVADTSAAPRASAADHAQPVASAVPMQPLQQPAPMPGATRLGQSRRGITVISSKPSTSATPLSRYSTASVVAPTRTSAPKSQSADLMASTGSVQPLNGLNASYKPAAGAAVSPAAAAAAASLAATYPVLGSHVTVADTNAKASVGEAQHVSVQPSASTESAETTSNAGNASVSNRSGSPAAAPSGGPKYRRDPKTLKRIMVPRPSSQSTGTPVASPQENGDDDLSSTSPPPSMT